MQQRHLTTSEWDALARDPEFVALLRARRRFIVPSTIFFLIFYLALPLGVVFAPQLMRRPALGSLTIAYAYGLLQFVMAWLLLAVYMVRARAFDERAQALVARAATDLAQ
jgi:uncharacterized membrane protein (DUF485 family)